MKPHPRQSDKIEISLYLDFPTNRNEKPSGDFVIMVNGEIHSADELRGSNQQAAIAILALLLGHNPDVETVTCGNPLKMIQSRNAGNHSRELNH